MLRRLGIRGKILAVVAVPILVLVLAAGFVTFNAFSDLQAARNAAQLVSVIEDTKEFQVQLREERDSGANYVAAYWDLFEQRAVAETSLDNTLAALSGVAAENPSFQRYVDDINDVLTGGADLTLADARDVVPTIDAATSWSVWPEAGEVTALVNAYTEMSAQASGIADGAPENEDLTRELGNVSFYLNQERDRAEAFLTVPAGFQERFLAVTPLSDQTWASLNSGISQVADVGSNESVRATLAAAASAWNAIPATREAVRDRSNSASGVRADYNDVSEPLVDSNSAVALAAGNAELSLVVEAYGAIDTMADELAKESNLVEILIRAQLFDIGDADAARRQFALTDFSLSEAQKSVAALGSTLVVPEWGASFDDQSQTSFATVRNRVSTGQDSELATVARQEWTTQVAEEWAAQEPNYDETIARAASVAGAAQQAALVTTILTAITAAAVVALSLIIALVIARRIVNPLRRLTTTATAVRQELPRLVERVAMPGETVDVAEVQIPVESNDEIGRLAEAFNGVNAATLAIASEQSALRGSISEMFVNVARRDQVLLNRQLQSIDEMERTEDNPETLTKLFALDHLATRMRRNSESLLVLAGIDTGRRLRRAMPLSDVIRTASSEIELYERVELELDADPAMLGHSSLTAAHLFAELLENATVFSDPGTPVVVSTKEVDGAYVVQVKDSGIGMTESELAEANNRVLSTAASEILGAQRLGLFVVGRIARRIGARVTLESAEGAGTTATVWLSASMFDPSAQVDVEHTRESIVDERLHAPAALVSHTAEDQTFVEPAPAPVVDGYQPTMATDSAPLAAVGAAAVAAAAASDALSVEDLIAADAADAPVAIPVDTEELTDGVGPNGLPTRRRREAPAPTQDESKNVIGLPARATADQLSALDAEAPDEAFAPAIPANEVSPQTPEDRAQMFRGFRPRRGMPGEDEAIDPEAESLGHAARRGAIAPEDIPALAAAQIPVLADDDMDFGDDDSQADAGNVIEDDDYAALGAAGVTAAMVIPVLEDDDEDEAYAPEDADSSLAAEEPVTVELEPDDEPVASVGPDGAAAAQADATALEADQPAEPISPAPAVAAAAVAAATPFSYADAYAATAQPEPAEPRAWGADQASLDDSAGVPSLDDIIAEPAAAPVAKAGFFSRLFKRNQNARPAAAPVAAAAAAPIVAAQAQPQAQPEPVEQPAAPAGGAEFAPDDSYQPPADDAVEAKESDSWLDSQAPASDPEYNYLEPVSLDPVPLDAISAAPVAPEPMVAEPSSFEPVAAEPVAAEGVSPGGAFALWSDRPENGLAEADAAGSAAEHVVEPPASGQVFTPDELANPYGWEVAGGAALAAAAPDAGTGYEPVVDVLEDGAPIVHDTEMTSAVFSELSSLSYERPKVEKTNAGLQRRRGAGEAAPVVKPIEPEVQLAHKERDADEVRNKFTSFYSGTQRARHDVQEFEQRSHPAEVKE